MSWEPAATTKGDTVKTTIIGIDPGAIHTGCVALLFNPPKRTIDVTYEVIDGVDVTAVRAWVETKSPAWATFIEDYNPGNYGREDKRMSEALGRLKAEFPPSDDPIVKYVDNAGINTLLPSAVLEIFQVDRFPVTTHHNDLVSAGKIALLGMLQDKGPYNLRGIASNVVRDALWGSGYAWDVVQHG